MRDPDPPHHARDPYELEDPAAGALPRASVERYCRDCGRDLRGIPADAPCPDCGDAPSPAAQPPSTPPEITQCVGCGYDLTGLSRDGVCPECGLDVISSQHGALFLYCDKAYLAKLHAGITLIVAGIAQLVFAVPFMIVAAIAVSITQGSGAVVILSMLVYFASLLMIVIGWFVFSARDPSGIFDQRGSAARHTLRIALGVMVAGSLFSTVLQAVGAGGPGAQPLLVVVAIANLAAYIVFYYASLVYVRWAATRIPDAKAVAKAKQLMWLGPVLLIGSFFLLMCGGFATLALGALGILGGVFSALAAIIIALIMYWNLLDRIRRQLKTIRIAREDIKGSAQKIVR